MILDNNNYFSDNKASLISDNIGSYPNDLKINFSINKQKDGEYIIDNFNSGDSITLSIQLGDASY